MKQYSKGALTGVIWSNAKDEKGGYYLEIVSNFGHKNWPRKNAGWWPTIEACKNVAIIAGCSKIVLREEN